MADKNIQIKHHNGTTWDNLFPKTKAAITNLNDGRTVEAAITDLVDTLAGKVTMQDVTEEIEKIVGTAPQALDTLKELADAIDNDANFASTLTTQIGTKVDKVTGKQLSTNDFTNALKTKLDSLKDHTSEIASLASGKADKTDTYTKTEVDGKINLKSDKSTTYTKSEVDTRINNLQANAIPVSTTEPEGASVWFSEI